MMSRIPRRSVMIVCLSSLLAGPAAGAISVDANFENGHIGRHVIRDDDTLEIGPLSGDRESWYSFRIKGVKGKRVTFIFEWLPRGRMYLPNFNGRVNEKAMITYDGLGYELVKDQKLAPKDANRIEGEYFTGNWLQTYSHTFREDEALVSYAAPFTNTHLADLAAKLQGDPRVTVGTIGQSRMRKLPITYFRITDANVPDAGKKRIFLTGREDSYEVGGTWAVEGVRRFLLSDDPVAVELRRRTVFYLFPILSVDGVAMGATNYPLNEDNSNYVYLTAYWDRQPPFHEVQAMKDFWNKLKRDGEELDVSLKCHATCYWDSHFRLEDCAADRLEDSRKLFGLLKERLPWRSTAASREAGPKWLNASLVQVFPKAITFGSHNDFIFPARYLGRPQPVVRRHEDVIQDGELIARAFGAMYGATSQTVPPFLMAGDTDVNHGREGDTVTFVCYYYDVLRAPARQVAVVIGGRRHEMKGPETPDYSRPVRFEYKLKLTQPRNDYYFVASNGQAERRVPEDYSLPGPFIVK